MDEIKTINRLTLSFENELENKYIKYYNYKYLFNIRFSILIACITWILFGILDQTSTKNVTQTILIIRYYIVSPLILLIYLATFIKFFRKKVQLLVSFGILSGGLGLIAIRTFSHIEIFSTNLHVGLIIILFYGYTIMRARFIWATISGFLILIAYILTSIFIINLPLNILIPNLFYLLSVIGIGMFSCYSIEYYSRKQFYNLQLLKEEQNKTSKMNKQLSIEISEKLKAEEKLKQYLDNLENLVLERTQEIRETQQEIIYRLGIASEFKDKHTGKHIKRLGHYSSLLAKKMGIEEEECNLLFYASQMHDVGKIGIPDAILLKAGKLDNEEMDVMKTHPLIGEKILKGNNSKILQMAKIIALTHHEKWDGTGYPHKLKGNEIPLIGQIASLCDIFDAMISKRSYKDNWPIEKVIEEMDKLKGTVFNEDLYNKFHQLIPEFLKIYKENS